MDDVGRNIKTLCDSSGFKSRSELAEAIGIARTDLSRILSGTRAPSAHSIMLICSFFRVREEDIKQEHNAFVIGRDLQSRSSPLLSFTSINMHRGRWADAFEKYKGVFKVYYDKSSQNKTIVSLLTLDRLTDKGITISFHNPYEDADGNRTIYEYQGLAFPVNEMLYCFAEQKNNNDYEIISMIVDSTRTPRVASFKGILSGVGVRGGKSTVAATTFYAQRRIGKERIASIIEREIGYKPIDKLTPSARLFQSARLLLE